MKLENKFFHVFFFQFLIGIILSSLIVLIFLVLFTNSNYDKRTSQNVIKIKKQNSKIVINSVNVLLTTEFMKLQSGLNELAIYYQKKANDLLNLNKNQTLNNTFLKCVLNLADDFCYNLPNGTEYMALWILDKETTEEKLNEKIDVKNELISFSNIIENLESILETTKPDTSFYFFYFDITELYLGFPLKFECQDNFINFLKNPIYEGTTCIDEKGDFYKTFKMKCETFFISLMKSKTSAFDNNYLSNQNKTIFIYNYFTPSGGDENNDPNPRVFDICLQFDDPITKGKGYVCTNIPYEDIIISLDDFNSQIEGYYFISNVGYNNIFYFPQGTKTPKTSTDNIYKWDTNFILEEKEYFHHYLKKIMSSNYINNIKGSIYDEVFVNGKNSYDQVLYINDEKFNFSIYPLILNNINGQREHIMSIIYIYKDAFFFDELKEYNNSIEIQIIVELLIFIIFGSSLLYIINLTFSLLGKNICIPIKNVNYMLKGINIGGDNRLKYLDFMKKTQEENLEQLEKIYLTKSKYEVDNCDELENNYDNIIYDKDSLINKLGEKDNDKESLIKKINDYYLNFTEKYNTKSDFIEKEFAFYDFDEQLLQYRPKEINNLFKSLIDLKTARILTSKDQEVKKIIDYSFSEKVFKNFKDNDGSNICQSNIGNMQSQLFKYDKAIYHLALSLQDNKLKKFLDKNLNDEFDTNDSLLNKLSDFYSNDKNQRKNNKLLEKQINNTKNNFSQQLIGILINTRYNRLIHAYYTFFKNMKKIQKFNNDNNITNEQFMNTSFHTINYYHKILIQFIFLSYIKNDLVKIGESILNYIEFLIKFKFKASPDNKYLLNIKNRNRPEFKSKQEFKKQIFDKIIKWFNLFDDYISYTKTNSSLTDTKCIINDYYHSLNKEKFEYNLETQTAFMFRINTQKSNFLKGKFSLCCKNYNDALFYFIRSAKKNCLVVDGLIKKKSLKHIFKLLIKIQKSCQKFGLSNLNFEKIFKKLEKDKIKIYGQKFKINHKRINGSGIYQGFKINTIKEEIVRIKEDIIRDINEYSQKREKNIIILIDFNIYHDNKRDKNIHDKSNKIESFIQETQLIVKNYLSINDNLAVLIYENNYRILCPLLSVKQIDNEGFSKDLLYYKNKIFNKYNENKHLEEYNINLNETTINELEFNLNGNNNISENSQEEEEESFEMNGIENEITYNKIKGLIKAINYAISYLKIKGIQDDKYIIIFTDMMNANLIVDEQMKKILTNLKSDKDALFLLVGRNNSYELDTKKNKLDLNNNKTIEKLILEKFGEKSGIIDFENMKTIKTILSNNKVIKEHIFYPNEIYK